jgi:membrane-associated phospholipid phosphatase
MRRFQSFSAFLNQWLQRNWQPLLFLFGAYLPLAIFVILAIQIWQLEGGLSWDLSLMTAIHSTANTSLDRFAVFWTQFGTKWGVFPATAGVGLGLLYFRRWRWLIYWLITLFGCALLNRMAKLWLHRVRPSLWEHLPEAEFSFPSGHAMSSMGFVMALVVLTWNRPWRIWVWLWGGLFVVSIAWTRLYLGVHYPSDILAGWMISIAWAVAVNLLVKPLLLPNAPVSNAESDRPG